jgi:hypothetical protein
MRILVLALLLAGPAAAAPSSPVSKAMQAPAAAGCGAALRAEADTESFTSDGARLARETGTAFVAAATHLCAAGTLRPAQLAPFTRLLVRSSDVSADPVVYDDAEQGADALILEYAFTGGRAPAAAAIETALRCWREPTRAGCDQGGE